jgi:ribose transport system ATP-binding protein
VKSSDALELAGLCDRVLVLSRGVVVSELPGAELTEEAIVREMVTAKGVALPRPAGNGAAESAAAPTRPASLPDRRRSLLDAGWFPLLAIAALMLIVGGYTAARSSSFLTQSNMQALLELATPLALVSVAQLSVLLVGGIDISVGALMTLVVVLASYWVTRDPLGALVLGSLGAVAIGPLVGLLNGSLVRWLRVNPVIATIAMLGILQGIALILRPSPEGIISFRFIGAFTASIGFVPWIFVAIVLLAVAGDVLLHRTGRGLIVRAVGFREEASRRVGIATTGVHLRAYVLAATGAALAGLVLASQVGVGDPTAGTDYTLRSIAAAVLGGASLFGGRGSAIGALVGALFLALTINIVPFLHLNNEFAYVATGALTLLAIIAYSRRRRRRGSFARTLWVSLRRRGEADSSAVASSTGS